jgi:hypothetical protein
VDRILRIGEMHGLSGQVHRVIAANGSGAQVSFIVKREISDGVERALRFHRWVRRPAADAIPTCYGGLMDGDRRVGWLFLEDIAPADQGDVLVDPGDDRAGSAPRAFARIHAASWWDGDAALPEGLPRWEAAGWSAARWSDRLSGARRRYPGIVTASWHERLRDLPERVEAAVPRLRGGPVTWIHGDAHLDNVLWRLDGSAVILDWAGAVIGPPAVDAVRFLVEGPRGLAAEPDRARRLIETYEVELRSLGMPEEAIVRIRAAFHDAMLPLAQGIVGWAGRPERTKPELRISALRENALRNVIAWLDA